MAVRKIAHQYRGTKIGLWNEQYEQKYDWLRSRLSD